MLRSKMLPQTFANAISDARLQLKQRSELIHTQKWQGVDISTKPEMATYEVRHHFIKVKMPNEDLEYYREQIKPHTPWADEHFDERVCGQPINPGLTWKSWPYGLNAQKFLDKDGKFNHNYMERYWPRGAGKLGATGTAQDYEQRRNMNNEENAAFGIYHIFGDLNDVIEQLHKDPLTRQAILPVFFPEDTGAVHGGRVPCSLTYQFLLRNGKLDISYVIRSCDYLRHFRDDIYLTVRLLLWVLDRLREKDPATWNGVVPGEYVMLIASLHLFKADWQAVMGAEQ